MAQWIRIYLALQGTQVRSLVWKDFTCQGATKPIHCNYWAYVPQLLKTTPWSLGCATREATAGRNPGTKADSSPCSLQLEKARAKQWRLSTAKKKKKQNLAFPSGLVVKNPPASAGDRKIPRHRATKPMDHNCWASVLEPRSQNYWIVCT